MSDFERFTKGVVSHLNSIKSPLEWLGINDPRIRPATLGAIASRGLELKEGWEHLDESADPFPALKVKTVALVTFLCIGRFMDKIDGSVASADPMGGGSVRIQLERRSNLAAILGASMMEHGAIATNPSNGGRWAGIALPEPDFGLSCFAREVTVSPPPYCSSPWVVGFEVFVQGLNQETTEALGQLDL